MLVSNPDLGLKLNKKIVKKISLIKILLFVLTSPRRGLQREHLAVQKLHCYCFPFQGPAVRPSWKPDPDICHRPNVIRNQSGLRPKYATLFEREKISVADPDVYPESRILIFTHPEPRIQKQQQTRRVKKNLLS